MLVKDNVMARVYEINFSQIMENVEVNHSRVLKRFSKSTLNFWT